MGTRNDDISLKLAKAVKQGFLPDVSDSEVDILTMEAQSLFGSDILLPNRSSALATSPVTKLNRKLIVSAEPGHSWVDTGSTGGVLNLNNTTDFRVGTQSISRTSNGAAGQNRVQNLSAPATDFTSKYASITVKLEGLAYYGNFTIYAAAAGGLAGGNYYRWDVSPVNAAGNTWGLADGKWQDLALNFNEAVAVGAPVKTAIVEWRLAFIDNNTGNPVKITVNKVESIPYSTTFPNGVWTLSMDDSWVTQKQVYKYAALQGVRVTLYTIADIVDSNNISYLTLDDLKEAQELGHEIAGHALTMEAHNNRLTSLTTSQLEVELSGLKAWLVRNGFYGSNHYCIPAGMYNKEVSEMIVKYFPLSSRTTYSQLQDILPPIEPNFLRGRSLGSNKTLAQAKAEIDFAYANKSWAHHYGHQFGAVAGATMWTVSDIKALIDYAINKGIGIATVGEVITARY